MIKNILLVILFLNIYSCRYSSETKESINVAKEQEKEIKKAFSEVYGEYVFENDSIPKSGKKIFYRNNYKIIFSSEINQDNIPQERCYLSISDSINNFKDTLDFKSSVFITSINADVDIFDQKAYIIWVSENFEKKEQSKIWLKIVDLKTNKVEYFNNVFSQKWGVERIALAFNPFNKTINVAYNDFTKPNSRYLYFGTLYTTNGKFSISNFQPKSILNQDVSEKRYPKFLRTKNSLFMYNTSGDTWGMFAHTGKQGIAISKINNLNLPSNYRILTDTTEINDRILIYNDTVFYEVINGNYIPNYPVKKVKLLDIQSQE